MRRSLLIGAQALLAMACLCGCVESGWNLISPTVPHVPPQAFDTAPDSLFVDGVRYDLQVTLWRDFMPMSPPQGRGLTAAVLIQAPAGKTIPPGLRPLWIWVRNKGDVWAAELTQQPGTPPDEMSLWAGYGPLWGPGIQVDVLLGWPDTASGLLLVAARDVWIQRTD